ncbi:fungal-specific transcription factor domain-containing protein [Scheffersomyces xylosifermentans]|uniref:fungal-specific transcription factor domain-containing protein n=1 Tax=Scheffersomyces xylosifermentans TaxID=1304137 RepID=UPI00315D0638
MTAKVKLEDNSTPGNGGSNSASSVDASPAGGDTSANANHDGDTTEPNETNTEKGEIETEVSDDKADESSDINSKKSSAKQADKPKAFTIKYKRPRGSRACTVCRSRKVRCDAEIHIPCTNCITFGCECILPEAKKRGNASGDSKSKRKQLGPISKETVSVSSESNGGSITTKIENTHEYNGRESSVHASNRTDLAPKSSSTGASSGNHNHASDSNPGGNSNEPILNISQVSVPPSLTSNYKNRPSIHKKELLSSNNRASLTFLGSSSIGVVAQKVGENHVQLTSDIFDINDNSLDSVELEILKLRGAFLLPSHDLTLDLINSYFEHVHPLMPVIDRTQFMNKFNDPNDNPSLMLLQAVLLCGCRVSQNSLLLDSKGSNNLASLTFFRRAKALYETNYESDPVSIVQTVILIGSYWEGPEDVTKNSFYWTRVAVGLAQGFGFQRDVNNSKNLSSSEKKVWRRIWWCLFEKDRNVAIAFGRPSVIDLNDCDVPMLTLDDFDENDPELGVKSPYPVNETQALYFIHLVKLAEITGIIIKHQYSVKSEQLKRKNKFSIIQHCDMLMGIWFTNLPPQLVFSLTDTSTQNFYSCLLNAQYYNRLYLIHRSNLIRMAKSSSTNPNNYKYPSWGISFQSARMISIVSKILLDRDQIKYCPVMYVYISFSALVMLIYHVDSSNSVISSTASDSLFVSRAVLRELAKYWPIAGVLMRFFDKYANDKIKRAKVIENGTRIAEYQELSANQKALNEQSNDMSGYYGVTNNESVNSSGNHVQGGNFRKDIKQYGHNHSPSLNSVTSGVSPGGGVYSEYHQNVAQPKQPNIDELVQQFKKKNNNKLSPSQQLKQGKDKTNDTSPTSSTQSFPDISLVTENLPTNQNFFENFEPAQLFPDVKYSFPPTRVQSPDAGGANEPMVGSNVYASRHDLNQQGDGREVVQEESYPPPTPFNTNFIDSSFINMNLQSGIETNYLNEDLASLFNLQY